jgi:GNAT superfamily N-acetyltransferase
MNIIIRAANLDDTDCLVRWAQAMAYETEQKILPHALIAPGIATGLANPQLARYFVAEINGEPAGTLMLTSEWSDWRNGLWLWIQSVYVLPEHRRKGIYRALYAHVQAMANQDSSICGIRLYVEKENQTAQQTYQALGMSDAHYLIFEQAIRKIK